jgi:hypothetical protein
METVAAIKPEPEPEGRWAGLLHSWACGTHEWVWVKSSKGSMRVLPGDWAKLVLRRWWYLVKRGGQSEQGTSINRAQHSHTT